MTREDAIKRNAWFHADTAHGAGLLSFHESDLIEHINKIYDDYEKELKQLEKDRDYWKLSFHKQVEAGSK